MSYIGNTPGVSSQRVVTEEVISGSPKSAFYPIGGYALGYVDVLVNGLEVDSSDFTAADGVVVTLGTAAAVGDTVKIKCYLPRGLSDGYLKAEADARFPRVDTASQGLTSTQQGNARTNINAQAALGYTPVNKAGDTMGGGTYAKSGSGNISFDNGTTDTPGVKFYYADNTNFGNDVMGSRWRLVKNLDETGGTELVTVDTSGNMSLSNGNLVLASGKGIDFSAGSNASGMTSELLNDYEEGTWTPSFTGTGSNPTINYNTQQGTYTKIGNVVTVSIRIITNSITGGSGNLLVSGLPFTSKASPNSVLYSAPLSFVYAFSLNPVVGFVGANDNAIWLYSSTATNTQSTVANLGAGTVYFSLSATYQAA